MLERTSRKHQPRISGGLSNTSIAYPILPQDVEIGQKSNNVFTR